MLFVVSRPGPEHRAFIEATFTRSTQEGWPWCLIPWHDLREDFRRRISRPGVRTGVAVLTKDPDTYLGWAAVDPTKNEILTAYTTGAYRSRDRFEPRVATTLVTELGIDLTQPTTLRYWTPAAETISKRPGYQLRPTTDSRPIKGLEPRRLSQPGAR